MTCWLIDGGSVAFVCFGGLGKGSFATDLTGWQDRFWNQADDSSA